MFAGSDNRGVCFLKTALPFFAGVAPDYSPLVRAPSFNRSLGENAVALARATVLDPFAGDEWDRAVSENPEATIFHSSAWAKVLHKTYGHTPRYLKFSQGDRVLALVPMMEVKSAFTGCRGVSLPFSDFCAPLFFGESNTIGIADRLGELARERNWKYFELRGAPEVGATLPAFDSFYGHKLDLTRSPNELFEGFDSSLRRAIRKAERSEVSIEVASDLSAISRFYRLHNRTRRRHGIPPQPFSFFRNIHEHILKPGLGFLVVANRRSRPIAAAVFFHFGQNALFKFGASDERFQELRGNNLVMWEGMKQAQSRGSKTLHLGRTDFEHSGLRRFKLSLGATEEALNYFRFDTVNSRWMTKKSAAPSKIPTAVFRSLPLTVNQLAGTLLYPHLH